jgi:iron complex outermembrane receptor protein
LQISLFSLHLAHTAIVMVKSRWFLLFSFIILFSAQQTVSAQCIINFSGRITDSDTRETLSAATVTIRELQLVTLTDSAGNFSFTGLCPGNYELQITHVDCQPLSFHFHLKDDLKKNIELPHKHNQLQEVVVVGNARLDTRGLSGEVKGKDLEAVKGLSLGESLKQVTGVSVLQTGTNIYKPVIHGMHSNRVLILNNGIRQEGQQWGSEHAPEIDPYIANRLTVIKGAASIRYGGDAIGGVVLVEPKLLRYVPGVSGEINTAIFSNNLQGVISAMVEGNSAKHPSFAWRLQGTAKRGGNARTPGYWLANSGVEEYNGSGTAGWRKKSRGLELFYSIFNTRLGIFSGSHIGNVTDLINAINGSEPPDYIKNEDFTYKIDRPYQQVQHQLFKAKSFINTGDKGRLNFVLSTQYNNRREYDIVRSQRTAPQLELRMYTGIADVVWDHYGGKKLKGTVGVSGMYQHNSYSYRYFIPNYQLFNAGVFAAEKLDLGKFLVEGGLRFDIRSMYAITDNDAPPNDKLTGNSVSPGVAYGTRNFNGFSGNFSATYIATDVLRFSAAFSSAWRSPQANEIYSDGLHHGAARIEKGDLNLQAERANSIMGAATYSDDNWNVEAAVYLKSVKDFIYLKPVYPPLLTIRGAFPAFRFSQTDARFSGIDLNANYLAGHHVRISLKGSLLRAFDKTNDDWLIQMPSDRGEAGIEYIFSDAAKWKQSYIKFNIQFIAQQSRVPETGGIPVTKPDGTVSMESDYAPPPAGYTLTGIEAGTELILKRRPVSIVFAITNLMDVKYRDYMNAFRYFSDDMGRNISLRLKVPFDFTTKQLTHL